MGLDLDKLNQKRKELNRKTSNFYRPSEGRNCIRVFLFSHEVTAGDIKSGNFPKQDLGKEVQELDRVVTRHFGIRADGRPVLSTPEILERYNKLKKTNKEEAQKIKPSRVWFMNIVDTDHVEDGMKLYACVKTVYDAILSYITDPDYGEEILGCKGRDFVINFDKNQSPATMYQVQIRKEGKSVKLGSELEKAVLDLYDEDVFSTMGEKSEGLAPEKIEHKEDEDEDEEELLPKKTVETEEEDEDFLKDSEDDDEEEEEEEEEKPKKKKVEVKGKKKK